MSVEITMPAPENGGRPLRPPKCIWTQYVYHEVRGNSSKATFSLYKSFVVAGQDTIVTSRTSQQLPLFDIRLTDVLIDQNKIASPSSSLRLAPPSMGVKHLPSTSRKQRIPRYLP